MSIPTFGDLRKKFFDGMWHAIGRILQGGLIGFLLAALSVEIAAYFLNSSSGATVWPPTVFTHVAALAFAIVAGLRRRADGRRGRGHQGPGVGRREPGRRGEDSR